MIAGTHSGCGKTTVMCALLKALKNRGLRPAAFKCGPDYIDPMFHRSVIGAPSYNLDPFFCPGGLKNQIAKRPGDAAALEAAMGYYDGIGPEGRYSAYDAARETQTPVALVIDAKGAYASIGATLKGFLEYRENSGIKGVIFNNASPALFEGLSKIAEKLGVKPLGFLPREPKIAVGSRRLGLITAREISDLHEKINLLGELAERYIDIDALLSLNYFDNSARVAVAKDAAFCFMYEENLEALTNLGCELAFFSPLRDPGLPENISGLYLCGGYPESYLKELSGNRSMLEAISAAINSGVPTIAECGGFLYLHEYLDGFKMAGVIPARADSADKLQNFGYVELLAKKDNLLCRAGESIRSREFHYYVSSDSGEDFEAIKPLSEKKYLCARATETLYAGFPHLYFDANPAVAENFVKKVFEKSLKC
jgi:cobyrinic acid a,c-diamide synthase